jgi:hypothetical protein
MSRLQALALAALLCSCGSGGPGTDEGGLVQGRDEMATFARASQLYFRGSLSRSREEFNSVVYGFPDSPLVGEARLAIRRIDSDLGGPSADSSGTPPLPGPSVAVVGLAASSPRMTRIAAALSAAGYDATVVEDDGSPDMTLVLYPDGLRDEALVLADTLANWLTQPVTIPVQPGGQITSAILPGHSGLVVVVGSDAVVGSSAPMPGQN